MRLLFIAWGGLGPALTVGAQGNEPQPAAPPAAAVQRPAGAEGAGPAGAAQAGGTKPVAKPPVVWPQRPNTPQGFQEDAKGTTAEDVVASFWARIDQLASTPEYQGQRLPVFDVTDGQVGWLVDKASVGFYYLEGGPQRYVALHLLVGNRSPEALTFRRQDFQAVLDQQTFTKAVVPPPFSGHSFQIGNQSYSVQNAQAINSLTAPANGVAGIWLLFGPFPAGGPVPDLRLELVKDGFARWQTNVTRLQSALLGVQVERIGPRGSLALLTIHGPMNTFNIYRLSEEVDRLATGKVSRCVIAWGPQAPVVDNYLANWFVQSTMHAGSGRTFNDQLPALSASLKEFHLVRPANESNFPNPANFGRVQGPPRLHTSLAAAVLEASRSLYLTLPEEQLRAELNRGHPLSQAAALVHGAPRLRPDDLSRVLEASRSEQPAIRTAGLLALGEFTAPEALARLEEAGRASSLEDRRAAVQALADSRFPAVRAVLSRLILDPDAALVGRIVTVLAERPRIAWTQELAEHVYDPQKRLRLDVLRALVPLEPPNLVSLLEEALNGEAAGPRDFAYGTLVSRTDERSEQLAADATLKKLASGPPDAVMAEFLKRTKDPRALPLLHKHLEAPTDDKALLVQLLGQIGDASTGERFATLYPQLKPRDQSFVLMALRQLRDERFIDLATSALSSSDSQLQAAAVNGLVQEGSPAAVRALVARLDQKLERYPLQILTNGLAQLGGPEARRALQKLKVSTNTEHRNLGVAAYSQLLARSPGYGAYSKARQATASRDWNAALEQYELAGQLDPAMAEAFAGQGDIHVKKERWAEARTAFGKAFELDPFSGLACSGLGIALVMCEERDKGIQTVEANRAVLAVDPNFSYNAACVYGRALQQLLRQPATPERDRQAARFRTQALADLKAAIDQKFDDFEWMREDPDLESLHDLPEFQQLSKGPKGAP